MQWKITPGVGVGTLIFGMLKNDAIRMLGETYDEFRRSPASSEVVTAFDAIGLHLVFSDCDTLKKITVFTPNVVFLGETQVLGRALDDVGADLKLQGYKFEKSDAGLWCEQAKVLLIDVDSSVDGVEISE